MGFLLIVISSLLLGIWATIHTIALRNALLGCGGLIALFYWFSFFRSSAHYKIATRLSLSQFMPLVLIGLMFFWVLFHYFFLSREPELQLDELKSTWLRSFLAVLVGSATGFALSRRVTCMPLLWLGLVFSFIVLLFQYIPKALANQSIFAVDWYRDYIYYAKFSGVLSGAILISGLLGMCIDHFFSPRQKVIDMSHSARDQKLIGITILIYGLLGILLVFFAFVFIFDAKAGVGLVFIIFGLWSCIGIVYFLGRILKPQNQGRRFKPILKLALFFGLSFLVVGWLAHKHVKNNPGWESLFSDVYVSAQIDKYNNWQNTPKFGFPKRDDGEVVRSNTYERVSWAIAGARLLISDPLGYGTLRSFPKQMKLVVPDFGGAPYTHSAWIDIGLAFGLPGLILVLTSILVVLWRTIRSSNCPWRASSFTISIAILILYAVGEYGFQHGIEILFFVCGLLSGLTMVIGNIPNWSEVDS